MNITLETLEMTESVVAIGAVAVKELRLRGQVTLFVSSQGAIELADPQEVALDALPEEQALHALLSRGYDDQRLLVYLRGREARKKG